MAPADWDSVPVLRGVDGSPEMVRPLALGLGRQLELEPELERPASVLHRGRPARPRLVQTVPLGGRSFGKTACLGDSEPHSERKSEATTLPALESDGPHAHPTSSHS